MHICIIIVCDSKTDIGAKLAKHVRCNNEHKVQVELKTYTREDNIKNEESSSLEVQRRDNIASSRHRTTIRSPIRWLDFLRCLWSTINIHYVILFDI